MNCTINPTPLVFPQKPYEYAEWKLATVNIDYHIEVDQHYYSVPFRLLRKKLDVRLTAHTVEAFQKGERVTAHVRSFIPHRHSTLKEHMPPALGIPLKSAIAAKQIGRGSERSDAGVFLS